MTYLLTGPTNTVMRFVSDLEPNGAERCRVEVKYDALTAQQVTVVHIVDGVTTSRDLERAFAANPDEHGMRVLSEKSADRQAHRVARKQRRAARKRRGW